MALSCARSAMGTFVVDAGRLEKIVDQHAGPARVEFGPSGDTMDVAVSSVWGSALMSAHVQLRTDFGPFFRVKRHFSVATRGVGLADNTRKNR